MLHLFLAALCAASVLFVLGASAYVLSFALLGLKKRPKAFSSRNHARFLVLVPAHNESWGITATLRSLQQADYPAQLLRIIVIADNCSDNTAEVARSCNVEVWVRNDPHNRGKGQALSWALDKATFPFDIATVIDADTEIDPLFFMAMNTAYTRQVEGGRLCFVLQSRYQFAACKNGSSWFEHLTIATKSAENAFSYRPRTALGLGNLIQGNGFCISRGALQKVPFGATSVVEDAEYAVTLALHDVPVMYVEDAQVISRMTQRLRDAVPQRMRWAGGTFALMADYIPLLLWSALRKRKWRLAEMALMLTLTSKLLLIYTSILAVVLMAVAYPFPHFEIAVSALAIGFILQFTYLFLVLRRSDCTPVPYRVIAYMPLYVGFLGAVQLGAMLGFSKQQWNRTAR